MSLRTFAASDAAQSIRRIDFESCEVTSLTERIHILVVRGRAPCLNMEVRLSPLIYVTCPEFWGIEVIGSLPGCVCLPAEQDYVATMMLINSIGYEGIEVIGATRSEEIRVSGGCRQGASLEADAAGG